MFYTVDKPCVHISHAMAAMPLLDYHLLYYYHMFHIHYMFHAWKQKRVQFPKAFKQAMFKKKNKQTNKKL